MKHNLLSILFILIFISKSFSQYSGKVVDAKTGKPLAFVNIVYNEQNHGLTTDIDGKFVIDKTKKVSFLKFSYVGYELKTLNHSKIYNKKNIYVRLKPKTVVLNEVIVKAKENPAHRIIKQVVKNRKINNPDKMRSFSYTSYNKMIFTVDNNKIAYADSVRKVKRAERIKKRNDSLLTNGRDSIYIAKLDSIAKAKTDSIKKGSNHKSMKEFFDSQHLFLMESVSQRNFKFPDKNEEIILANRMSGFKNPLYTMLATQMQSFSFYNDMIMLFDKSYLNPISPGSTRKYLFIIEDTTFTENGDSVFVLSYRPRKNKNFEGLQGILNISTNKYAIESVIAKPYENNEVISINIQQKYDFINNQQWFPVELNTDIVFNMVNAQTVEGANINIIGIGKSYLKDITLNPEFNKKRFSHIAIQYNEEANKRDEAFWNQYRAIPLTDKDKETYHVIDSVGEEIKLDEKIKIAETIANGYIPWKFINIPYDKILNYNNYEGVRLGIAAQTNNKISSLGWIGGYFAYGFKDKDIKYGWEAGLNLYEQGETKLKFEYKYDVLESGSSVFFENKTPTTTESFRNYLIDKMDNYEQMKLSLSFRTMRYFRLNLFAGKTLMTNKYDNRIFSDPDNNTSFMPNNFIETGLQVKFAFKEKFFRTPRAKISLGTKYPIIWANISKNHALYDGNFDFLKYEIKIQKSFRIRSFGKTSFQLTGGMIDGTAPYSHLFNGKGSYKKLSLESVNSFNTMRMNEFVSDKYAAFFLNHNFESLLLKTKKFAPEIVLVQNIAWGSLGNFVNDFSIPVKTLQNIYYESGILINALLKQSLTGLGVGIFYRYGSYKLPKDIDNFAFKLSFSFNL